MKKHVWILNHYAGSMFFDKGGRHYNFAKYLRRAGYEPVIFCCNAKHGQQECFFEADALWHEHMAEEIETPFIFVDSRTYIGNGKQRILNMVDFCRNVQKAAKEYAKQHGKPDVIYASSVHPLTLVAGERLAKYFGVKCICEVRDLWPETIVNLLPQYRKEDLLIRLLYRGEYWIYKKADQLIFTMEGGKDYILHQKWDTGHGKKIDLEKAHYINNGVDWETFQKNREQCQISDPDLKDPCLKRLIYVGSIRPANGLYELLDCAQQMEDRKDVRFLIYGGGEEFGPLQQEVERRGLKNFILKGPVPKNSIPYVLSRSYIGLLNYSKEAMADFEYGGSQNKLFEYLASGRPLLSNMEMNYDIVNPNHCGYAHGFSTGEEYAQGVQKMLELSEDEYQQMCANAEKTAHEYDFKNLTEKLIRVIEG